MRQVLSMFQVSNSEIPNHHPGRQRNREAETVARWRDCAKQALLRLHQYVADLTSLASSCTPYSRTPLPTCSTGCQIKLM